MSEKQVTTDAEVIEANVRRPGRRSGLLLAVVAAALALVGGAALWQSSRLLRQVDERVDAAANASSAELKTQIDALNQRVESMAGIGTAVDGVRQELSTRLDSLNDKQTAMQQQVNAAVSSLANVSGREDGAWLLEEAQHLLGIAEQRLRLARDVPTAIAAAESVDRRLADANDPALIPIREQLIADLAALRAVPAVDTAGISLTLSSLIDRVEELPLKGGDVAPPPASTDAAPAVSEGPGGWRGAIGQMWKDLLGLVDVRSASVPDDVIFDPEKRYLLQQGLRLELAAARLDALRGATEGFRASIGRIDTQLDRYFDTEAAPVAAARESLASLRDVDLSPALPGFEKSMQLLAAQRAAAAAAVVQPASGTEPGETPADDGAASEPIDDAASAVDETAPAAGTELHVQPAPPDMGLTPPVDAAPTTPETATEAAPAEEPVAPGTDAAEAPDAPDASAPVPTP
jgi:uroporphyrin-3 C-methyltransferase